MMPYLLLTTPSCFFVCPGIWSQVKRAPVAAKKRIVFEVPGPDAAGSMPLDARAREVSVDVPVCPTLLEFGVSNTLLERCATSEIVSKMAKGFNSPPCMIMGVMRHSFDVHQRSSRQLTKQIKGHLLELVSFDLA